MNTLITSYLLNKTTLRSQSFLALLMLGLMLSMSACSNTAENTTTKTNQALNQHKVELGTVVAVRMIEIKPDANRPNYPLSNVGIAASSGGFRGIYGSIDLATFSRLFKNNSETKTAQEIIVKKNNGETVAITQAFKETFKQGDAVKILVRNGYAQVVH